MNGLFWLVRGDGDGDGNGFGFGAESDIHTPRILAVPRTLGAHAAAAQTGVLSFIKE